MRLVIYLLLFMVGYKLLSNGIFYFRTIAFRKRYQKWLFVDRDIPMTTYKPTLKSILKKANISDAKLPFAQPVGFGQIATGSASVLNNFPSISQDHAAVISRMIDEALGVFRNRFWETFNPLYWIDAVIFLPRSILSYLGLNPESVFVKILNIVWWLVAPATIIFRKYVTEFFLSLFS